MHGSVQLVEAIRASGTRALTRVRKGAVFLLSLCGAAAALGVCFFAVLDKNEMAHLMACGLLSTAAALVLTGSLFLAEAKAMGSSDEEGIGSRAGSSWDASSVS